MIFDQTACSSAIYECHSCKHRTEPKLGDHCKDCEMNILKDPEGQLVPFDKVRQVIERSKIINESWRN